ncbi:MAG: hypothetical protein Q9183_001226 [Haloplaca sp. 2 TL-2023]
MPSNFAVQRTLAFSLFFLGCLASPVSIAERAISGGDYANLQLFEQFAAAAYCEINNNGQTAGDKITCPAGNCPLVESSDVVAVYEFQK